MPATPLSSNIESWEYDAGRRVLTIVFRNGRVYEYIEVPQDIAEGFEGAPSAGSYLASEIKGRFEYRRVA